MNYKKIIAVGLTSATLLSGAITTVSAAQMQLTRTSYVYNAKGKRTKKRLSSSKELKILGKKIIKGKKFYRVGKNKYVLASNFAKIESTPSNTEPSTDSSNQNASENNNYVDPSQQARDEFEKHMQEEANKFGNIIKNNN